MGNRHAGEKATKEDKEEKRRKKKEKKAKKKQKKAGGAAVAGSDVDLDPESSQFSRADSESLVFHSAENLSPYLDASTRSEEGAACVGFYDNGHILSSKDFHDGFSIEACLPADLAASALMSDLTADVSKVGDDVTSMASGVYSTPLLSSPDVRRGIPRSPLAQRQKDSFLEPVPPIPSDFSSNTLSSVSYQEGVSTPGTQRSSSRASSSTVDTNAAHCIERLEELERNIERTIIEKFAPIDPAGTSSENTTPRLLRRAEFGDRSREGSMTPKGVSSDGALAQSPETSPAIVRKISEPCRPMVREGSTTPVGVIHGMWSQSAENSPVIVRKALPNPESPIILRRTPSQSPSVERKFPANAPESPVFYRRTVTTTDSPGLSPNTQRRLPPPPDSQEKSPQLVRRAAAPEVESSGTGTSPKPKVPPPVPPKPVMKTLTSPEIARRLQNMPKSPIMARKVYAFQEQQPKEKSTSSRDDPWDRSRRDMPPKSPSRSPEVRHRVTRKTPSSSPSPKSLVRKLMPPEDRAPPPVTSPPCHVTQIQFCQQEKGIPVKHCTVGTQPSAAVVLDMGSSEDSVAMSQDTTPTESKQPQAPAAAKDGAEDKTSQGTVSEDSIKRSTETAVFGSVSPKLKRQKKMRSGDESSHSSSFDHQRGDSTDSSTRSPPCSPPLQRSRPALAQTGFKDSEGSDHSPIRGSIDSGDQSPGRARALFQKRNSRCKEDGTLSADIAGGLTYHTHLQSDDVTTSPQPLRDRGLAGEHLESAHYPVTHREPDSTSQNLTSVTRTGTRGVKGVYDLQSGTGTFTQASSQHYRTAPKPSSLPQHETASPQSAVIADSTVEKNAARETGEYTGITTHASARTDNSRACRVGGVGGGGEREEERVLSSSPCQRVPSLPPSPPPPTYLQAGDGSGSGGGGGGSSRPSPVKPVRTNLGQRIRDVINNADSSSSFCEVFTAELSSSSSVEKDGDGDGGGTCTSDDSVFTASAHGAPSLPLHPLPHHPSPHHTTNTTLSSPPLPPQRVQGKCVGVRGTGRHATSQGSNPIQPPAPHHDSVTLPLESHPSPDLDCTAIRRIDIDVNVILPEGENLEGGPFPPAGQYLASGGHECVSGQGGEMTDTDMMDSGRIPDQDNQHSSRAENTETIAKKSVVPAEKKDEEADCSSREAESTLSPPPTQDKSKLQPVMEAAAQGEESVPTETVKNASAYNSKKGERPSQEVMSASVSAPPSSLPNSAPETLPRACDVEQREERRTDGGSSAGEVCFPSESKSRSEGLQEKETARGVNINTNSPSVPTDESPQDSKPASSSQHPRNQPSPKQADDACQQDNQPELSSAHQTMTDTQPTETLHQENVPPPSPTAMDMLAEEDEEEEEEVNSMINAHQDSDISTKISQEMQMFGETVVKRLSSLLESQASESDSCLEESRSDLLTVPSRHKRLDEARNGKVSESMVQQQTLSSGDHVDADRTCASVEDPAVSILHPEDESVQNLTEPPPSESFKDNEPVLHEELNTFSDLPGERLVTSDTTETLSTGHDTSASSKRESTASTATDETLTSFKTRSTTDSAEFEDAFILPESLVFVRSVNEGVEGGGAAAAVVETGRIIKRPPIPAELTRHTLETSPSPHKPRKKRRRQQPTTYDVSTRADVTEPEPKRGSKQIQEVIDAYCEEEMSDESDTSSSSSSMDDILRDELVHRTTYSRSEHQPRLPSSAECEQRDIIRKPKPPADRDTDSSDESTDLAAKRQSSSSHDSSFRIPEIEETFGELMGVKTFLEDLEDKPPTTSEAEPVLVAEEEKIHAKEFPPSSAQHRRRSKTSPARTDRTESDLDVSEHRDDASTDSMYADDEDEGTELVFQRSYSEEHGGEVVLSCTIYNSSRDNDADSDEFWADAEASAAVDESYKSLETAADAAGSAFQNARIQMHDIHQHLQDLRRQMELLQDDITSTSLTLTPEFSLESEQRPVTE